LLVRDIFTDIHMHWLFVSFEVLVHSKISILIYLPSVFQTCMTFIFFSERHHKRDVLCFSKKKKKCIKVWNDIRVNDDRIFIFG